MSKKPMSKKVGTSKASERKDTSKTRKKEEPKKEENKKEESKKDESKKEESKEVKADSTKDEKKDKEEGKSEAPKDGKDSKKDNNDDKKEEGTSKGEAARSTSNATPEQIKKNQDMLDKVFKLMETLKPDQVTRSSKDDLRVVQQLIKNITFRDYGDKSGVREVELSDKQKEIIKLISGSACNSEVDVVGLTMTEGEDGKSVSKDKINFPFEKLEFVKTKS